jgi:uncharacterized membrane protein
MMMWWWGTGMGSWFWLIMILGCGWFFWWGPRPRYRRRYRDTPLESARGRYARGEISREEFEEILENLQRSRSIP